MKTFPEKLAFGVAPVLIVALAVYAVIVKLVL